ncbi:hypothetical protein BH09VER1_BH09VER1_45850 [soil metagenome]
MILLFLFYFLALILPVVVAVRLVMAVFSASTRAEIEREPLRHLLLLGTAVFLWVAPWGEPLGYLAAQGDALRGSYHLNSNPLRADVKSRIAFSRLLRDRYGIFSPALRSCMVISMDEIRFESAYDSVMLPAIQRHFGRDVVEECKLAAGYETMK